MKFMAVFFLLSTSFGQTMDEFRQKIMELESLRKKVEKLENLVAKGGQETGNGGGGFYCEKDQRVHLLDFWEGESLKNLVMKRNANPLREQIEAAIAELRLKGNGSLASSVEVEARSIMKKIASGKVFLPDDVAIAAPADARHTYMKRGCELKGFALYNDVYDTLDIDKFYYTKMDETQKAGLIFHEAVYKVLRDRFKVTDSIVARNITACAFAKKPCEELNILFGVPDKNVYTCSPRYFESHWTDDPSKVLVFKDKGNCKINNTVYDGWKVQVLSIGSKVVPTRTYINFCPHLDLTPYLDPKLANVMATGGHQEMSRAKSSEEPKKDIGLKNRVHVSFNKDGFYINNHKFYCY